MLAPQTEGLHAEAVGLDTRDDQDILALLAAGQSAAADSVATAAPAIAAGAVLAAQAVRDGGRLVYAAAGSSGLMALADALELPGTYGIPRERIVVLLAGGSDALVDMKGGPEDDGQAARSAVEALGLGSKDCLIAITASGYTPYPLAALDAASAAGARTIGIANNAGAPILTRAQVGICLPTPPEVIAGSTRMGAGTAQKIALNMLSTLMAIRLGHVHDGYMVNVVADNAKLRGRARGIVQAIAKVDAETAEIALLQTDGAVKPAVLVALGVGSHEEATTMLGQHGGNLRSALDTLLRR
ncbi:N-acetylmuramic acid 6-phosphate etherase [Devosia lucknowensis]|uniref:N-acetylmuramic acid 6-phosphate etherase n=1 Tax=Devosia lucknowensis TaxID=1096929 RepID=A0A1Y6EIZ5_9HYPH|nr:N-acetylmuramic acid 6-phosphate etherase [Devosia lucknowensis]SMQ62567.1 N-acetylmuramic acid 6-phosphate etherase [Devosia lucknowensis]